MPTRNQRIGVGPARLAQSNQFQLPPIQPSQLPLFAYDPALEAERRAGHRGLGDLLLDAQLADRYGLQDLRTARRTIARGNQRAFQDARVAQRRGLQQAGWERDDARLSFDRGMENMAQRRSQLLQDAGRAREDFATRLRDISRTFGQLRSTQNQAINASGVTGSSSGAGEAAQRVRAENQRLAEEPIHTARSRMEQDLATNLGLLDRDEARARQDLSTALGRLGTATGQMRFDTQRWAQRQRQDVARDRMLTNRGHQRQVVQRGHQVQRARREQRVADANLLTQQIFQARQQRPGAFRHLGRNRRVL